MRAALRVAAVASGAIVACQFTPNRQNNAIDAPTVDVRVPDGGACTMASSECVGDVLRTCAGPGATTVDTTCSWGCGSASAPHCLQIVPAGGAVMPGDVGVGSDALIDLTLGSNTLINTDTGSIQTGATAIRLGGTGVFAGIDYEQRGSNAGVIRVKSLTVNGSVSLRGRRAIAFAVDGAVDVSGVIDARGTCSGIGAGPGGFSGGGKGSAGLGDGGGAGSDGQSQGGGGGGYGGSGGPGGNGGDPTNPIAGGSPFGDAMITVLVGGAGGGGGGNGGGGMTGVGGGGGGALQIISNAHIAISANGGINAGGCGGRNGGGGNDGGGGGGAGGTILLEAPVVQITGALAVNGGGGGGGASGNVAGGASGTLDRNPATGGNGGASGGVGGAGATPDGATGGTTGGKGGGGGGGVGRIRMNTKAGTATVDAAAVLSPSLTDVPTTCTQGSATLQ